MALDRDIDILSRIPLLSLIDRDALKLLAFSGEMLILRTGNVLFRQNDPSEAGFIVLSGGVELHEDAGEGGVPVHRVKPGALLGEMSLFVSQPHSTTAIAHLSSSVMKLPSATMRRVLGESPRSAQAIRRALHQRLSTFAQDLIGLDKRLAAF